MNEKSVSLQNIGKAFRLYQNQRDRLKEIIFSPFGKRYGQDFWALRDINFEVERGETFGVIGRNGSGKSTLLQIIAGVLQPTTGSVQAQGRVTALLELGSGFSPEFTGRENIFLSGAILGLSEKTMRDKLEEIIDFAQIGEYLDQPVKLYSSGMYVRLAFSVATSVEPDVLIVDEALAVGDAGFVIRCMQRMKHMKERGATIVLVSHDVHAVRSLCDRAVWLHAGHIKSLGETMDVTSQYVQFLVTNAGAEEEPGQGSGSIRDVEILSVSRGYYQLDSIKNLVRWGNGDIKICGFRFDNGQTENVNFLSFKGSLHLEVEIQAQKAISSQAMGVGFSFRNMFGLDIITFTTFDEGIHIPTLDLGEKMRFDFALANILAPGEYALILNVEDRSDGFPQYYDFVENVLIFTVVSDQPVYSLVLPKVTCQIISPSPDLSH
jgi:ABC-type polysaccharide/polyol phosphate transport system ATPase subunit